MSISQQTATVDGIPSTAQRTLSVDHLLVLDQWTPLGRLDAASEKQSRGWLAIGGLRSTADETFVVCGRVVQVHRDERLHGPETASKDPVESPKLTVTVPAEVAKSVEVKPAGDLTSKPEGSVGKSVTLPEKPVPVKVTEPAKSVTAGQGRK